MRKILRALWIIQKKTETTPFNRKYDLIRVNPYNPLSYITILLVILIGIFMFGFVGFWKEIDLKNPFKYQQR